MTRWVLLLGWACASCSIADSESESIAMRPAHWTHQNERLEPAFADFTFDAVHFLSSSEGWIVGNRFIVHVMGERMEMTSVSSTGAWLNSVDFRTPARGWAAGFEGEDDNTRGIRFEYADGRWMPRTQEAVTSRRWFIGDIREAPSGEVWVSGTIDIGHTSSGLLRFSHFFLRRDGSAWQIVRPELKGIEHGVYDFCFYDAGGGWFLGSYRDPFHGRSAVALRWHDGGWSVDALPEVGAHRLAVGDVRCLPDGGALAQGLKASEDPERPDDFVLVYDGTWRVLPLPERFAHYEIETVAGSSLDDIWVVVESRSSGDPCSLRFLHRRHGTWSEVPKPTLPDGRCGGYNVTDMAFPTPEEGWAIANDAEGPGLVHGLIFHYRDGVWRNRNWNWHFWDAPWFDLFGE